MRLSSFLIFGAVGLSTGVSGVGHAQARRDATTVLSRDVTTARPESAPRAAAASVEAPPAAGPAASGAALFVGAVNIDGAREIPREALMPAVESFIGKSANAQQLQDMARAIANQARERGYLFASAMIPEQSVESGTVTVILDSGSVDAVRITGSDSLRLRRSLERIVGKGVQRTTVERQLLLAGDIPGITVISTRYAREGAQGILFIEVREEHHVGVVGLDNYGSRDLGPIRLRLRYDLTDVVASGDQLTAQVVLTPLQPKELAFGSLRYAITLNGSGTQIGVSAAAGRTKPDDGFAIAPTRGSSIYAAIFASQPIKRSNKVSLWANAELAALRIDQTNGGLKTQRDSIVTATISASGNVKLANGRLWGGIGVVRGLGLAGTTAEGDPFASRPDGSARFTKGTLWLNWTGPVVKGLSLQLAANGQIADRPLLAAQEIAIGGPGFGRAFDFSERFGDSGILGLIELRRQFDKPVKGVDWVQLYGFSDGGYVDNLRDGFGGGSLISAGGGLRAAFGKADLGVEAAFPLNEPRFATGTRSPRFNFTVGRRF